MNNADSQPVDQPKSNRLLFQVRISTVLLLIAALSSWLGYWVSHRETLKLESQLPGLRSAARELQVNDEDLISIVHRRKQWSDENIWDFYLPVGHPFQVCVATENVEIGGLANPTQSKKLVAGRHKMELIHNSSKEAGFLVSLLIDDEVAIEIANPQATDLPRSSTGGSQNIESQGFSPEVPLVVFRKRFMNATGNGSSSSTPGSVNGILVWIEPVNE